MSLRARKASKKEVKDEPKEQGELREIEISAGMQGDLVFKDPVNLQINGTFQGSLKLLGTLSIGKTANVSANINGENIVISGKVAGDIVADKMLVLMPTAVLKGDVSVKKLNIVEGAIFNGNCKMMNDLLMNLDEVSRYLEIDASEIEVLVNSGEIPATKDEGGWKFTREEIDSWASSGQVE